MADKKPGRGSDQFPLRLPDGMRERIKADADKGGRSMNSEIVMRLEQFALTQEVAGKWSALQKQLEDAAETESELRKRIASMERYIEALESANTATSKSADATRGMVEMYEEHISDLETRLAEIARGAKIFGDAIASAAEGQALDLRSIVEAASTFPSDEVPSTHMADFVKVLTANPELSGPLADALKAGNADEAVRLLEAIGETDATGKALHESRLEGLKK